MKALILVDIQNDFIEGGALAVPEGTSIISIVNELQQKLPLVVATQDFHPATHGSFAASHEGKTPGEVIDLNGLDQVLWPVHCVQGSTGADFAPALDVEKVEEVFQKGMDEGLDSYSGFYDNGHRKSTGMGEYLKKRGVDEVFIVGLATDYCVKFTSLDALSFGFKTYLIEDATRGVNLQVGDVERAVEEMKRHGVQVIQSKDLL